MKRVVFSVRGCLRRKRSKPSVQSVQTDYTNGLDEYVGRLQRTVEQNVRDTQMTTRVTKGARLARPPSFPASRGFDARARVPPLTSTKSEEKERLLAVYLQRRLCERLLLLNITPQSTRLEKNRSDNLKFLLVPTSLK